MRIILISTGTHTRTSNTKEEVIMNDRDFLNIKEAAEYLRVSTKKVYDLKATRKDFPFHKIDEKLVFNRDELRAWVLSQ